MTSVPDSHDWPNDKLVELRVGGVSWQATPDAADLLRSADWAGGDASALGEPVKANPVRRVYRLDGPPACFLKICDESALFSRLKRLIRGPTAGREWRNARAARARGVPVPPPLALGAGAGVSFLLSESVEPADDLDDYLDAHGFTPAASDALADLLAAAYRGGVLHRDLHAGNILYRHGDGPGGMWLLDLQRAALRKNLGLSSVTTNLGMLVAGLRTWADDADLAAMLSRLAESFELEGPLVGGFLDGVLRAADRHAWYHQLSRDREVMRVDKYLARVRPGGGWRGWAFLRRRRPVPDSPISAMAFTRDAVAAALADPPALPDETGGEGEQVVKASGTSRVVRRRLDVGGQSLDVFVKHYPLRIRAAMLVDPWRASRAARSYRVGHQLLNRGVPTALPVAALDRRCCRLLLESIVITEAIDGAVHLARFANHELPAMDATRAWRTRTSVARALGRAIRRMRAGGFVHRDMKAPNVLVAPAGDDGRRRVAFVDLDGCRKRRWTDLLGDPRRELTRLNADLWDAPAVTRTDRLRVLLACHGRRRWKQVWRQVEASTRKRLARK